MTGLPDDVLPQIKATGKNYPIRVMVAAIKLFRPRRKWSADCLLGGSKMYASFSCQHCRRDTDNKETVGAEKKSWIF